MIILIDNYDSFTFNVFHYLSEIGAKVNVYRNDKITSEEVLGMKPQAIVLSPGPKTPDDAGICLDLIHQTNGDIPIFGVCLGHQSIAQNYGATHFHRITEIEFMNIALVAIPLSYFHPVLVFRFYIKTLKKQSLSQHLRAKAWLLIYVCIGGFYNLFWIHRFLTYLISCFPIIVLSIIASKKYEPGPRINNCSSNVCN